MEQLILNCMLLTLIRIKVFSKENFVNYYIGFIDYVAQHKPVS